ncbi:MAG: hypothetical protein CMK09_14705 [Ponticaulis sp.]|nr:hypothetical protein [Ponticaulis sp.]|tara:strand:- start:3497 stop:4702 length:1206 start_codon:yes stop_codon:yes gene_type:complete
MSVLFAISSDGQSLPEWFVSRTPNEVERVPIDQVEQVKADRIVWLVPGTDVFLAHVEATARSSSDLRTAALYQLEDDVSEAVSKLHLALGPQRSGPYTGRLAAIVSLAEMSRLSEAMADFDAGFASRIELIPETSLFAETGAAFIYDGDDKLFVGDGNSPPTAIDPQFATELLPALIHQLGVNEADLYHGAGGVVSGVQLPPTLTLSEGRFQSFAQFVSSPLLGGEGIDLRQGEFAPRKKLKFGVSGWTSSLVLAGLALVIWLASTGIGVVQLNAQGDRLYDRMTEAYSARFPEEGRVADPRRAVASKLGALPGGNAGPSFIELASVFYTGLSEVEGVELDSFSFDAETERLTATLRFSGYQDREQLKQIFEEQGIPISLGGARQENGAIVGEAILGGTLS